MRMKAYGAYDILNEDKSSTVVFAENANKAKFAAMNTEACDCSDYVNIRVRRLPKIDRFYKGQIEGDWDDPDIRFVMVKDYGWFCLDADTVECEKCVAKEYCAQWESH